MSEQSVGKRDNKTLLLIVIIVLSICLNIFLYWKLNQKQDVLEVKTQQSNMDSVKIADLDMKYSSALQDIEGLRGQNTSLDSLLDIKENEIKSMKAALYAAKKAKKISDTEYLAKIQELQNLVNDLKNQITQLETEKNILVAQKDSIGRDLDQQVLTNNKLKQDKAVSDKKALLGSLLTPRNIVATGVKGKGKGKEVTTDNAKRSERIRVCFDVEENKVADPGSKTFLLRLIGPDGAIINVQSLGSGKFQKAETNDEMIYTTKQTINYEQKPQNVCIYWGAQGSTFSKGKYTAEIYQDGYLTAKKEFTLK
ncbi:MAG TPA: hypothetical protein DCQ93_06760 [Bacteroidetes bacterium]|nr:hypothetical protein [Bacteroidota bacterium]